MAKKHIRSLFALQEKDGFVGHMIFWNNILPGRITDIFQSRPSLRTQLLKTHMSALIQPPLVAQAVLRIYRKSEDKAFLNEMLPKLKAYYNYISEKRDFQNDGLIAIITTFESGMDWKPSYDQVVGFSDGKANWRLFLKVIAVDVKNFSHDYYLDKIHDKNYFMVKDVCFNSIYAQNLKILAELCDIVQDPDAELYRKRVEKNIKSMLDIMYDHDTAAFYDVYGKENKMAKVLTPTIFFPLIFDEVPDSLAKSVLKAHYHNPEEFDLSYPLSSVAKNQMAFNPRESIYLWRGPYLDAFQLVPISLFSQQWICNGGRSSIEQHEGTYN